MLFCGPLFAHHGKSDSETISENSIVEMQAAAVGADAILGTHATTQADTTATTVLSSGKVKASQGNDAVYGLP